MLPDSAPTLVVVDDPNDLDAVEALVCPMCWNVTGVWLGKPTAKCEVCEERFDLASRVALL